MLIGLSLSGCISDIHNGYVKVNEVEKIHVSRNMPNLLSLLKWIHETKQTFRLGSYFTPLAVYLWLIGKIDSPVSRGEKPYCFASGGVWADENRDVFYFSWGGKKRFYSGTKVIREQDIEKRTIHVVTSPLIENDYDYILLDNSIYVTHGYGDYIPVDQYKSLTAAIMEKEKIELHQSRWYLIQKVHQHEIRLIQNEGWQSFPSHDVPQIIVDSFTNRK